MLLTERESDEFLDLVIYLNKSLKKSSSETKIDQLTIKLINWISLQTIKSYQRSAQKEIKNQLLKELKELMNQVTFDDDRKLFTHCFLKSGIIIGLNTISTNAITTDQQYQDNSDLLVFNGRVIELFKIYVSFRVRFYDSYLNNSLVKNSHLKVYHQILQQLEVLNLDEKVFQMVYDLSFIDRRSFRPIMIIKD